MAEIKWIIELNKQAAASGLDWARNFFARYDTSQILWIRIGNGRGRASGVYGKCWYPAQEVPYYRISCQVPGPFPYQIETRRPPIYRNSDGSWPPLPVGCVEGIHCRAEHEGQIREWKRVIGHTEVLTVDEAITWIVSHEAFHFLRRTRQIAGRNTEIEADQFADDQLRALRTLKTRWKRQKDSHR